jgi:hypothetical protein
MGSGSEWRPADLGAIFARVNTSAESRRHQLCAQANAERGLVRCQALADAGNLVLQKWIVLLFVNSDRTTQNHQ